MPLTWSFVIESKLKSELRHSSFDFLPSSPLGEGRKSKRASGMLGGDSGPEANIV